MQRKFPHSLLQENNAPSLSIAKFSLGCPSWGKCWQQPPPGNSQDIKQLWAPKVKREFIIELSNGFSALEIEGGEDQDTVKMVWNNIIIVYKKPHADIVFGFKKKRDKQWIILDT